MAKNRGGTGNSATVPSVKENTSRANSAKIGVPMEDGKPTLSSTKDCKKH